MKRTSLYLILIFCWGCTSKQSKLDPVIELTDSNRSITISGFDKAVIGDIARNIPDNALHSLLPVYKMPVDTDMKDYQQEQPGKYSVSDTLVIFIPDTPFKKGQTYFLRYYPHNETQDAWQYIKDKKRPGALSHKDLVFSY